jgi:hypothetical protein
MLASGSDRFTYAGRYRSVSSMNRNRPRGSGKLASGADRHGGVTIA